jgi:hypothetical protein
MRFSLATELILDELVHDEIAVRHFLGFLIIPVVLSQKRDRN